MSPTLKTRKPIDKLTIEDLNTYPIWEFALDEEGIEGQDETYVRPLNAKCIGKNLYSLCVAANFHTASGMKLQGLVGVSTDTAVKFAHGAVIIKGEYFFLPSLSDSGGRKQRKAISVALGKVERQVFPLQFTLRVMVKGEKNLRAGEIR